MIQIIDNFISQKICDSLIKYFNKNTDNHSIHRDTIFLRIKDDNIKIPNQYISIEEKINNHSLKINNSISYYIEIVKWPEGSYQNLHTDKGRKDLVYSSIFYLNDEYLGGKTFFEDDIIVSPKKGRALFFDGTFYRHGVLPIKKTPRYTLATWYKKT